MQVCTHEAWCVLARPAVIVAVFVLIFARFAPTPTNKPDKTKVRRIEREVAMHSLVAAVHFVWFLSISVYTIWLFARAVWTHIGTDEPPFAVFEVIFVVDLTRRFDYRIRVWYTHLWNVIPIAALWLWIDLLFVAYREHNVVLQLLVCGGVTFAALDVYRFGRLVSEYQKIHPIPSIVDKTPEK